jgi:hypothetical protein
MSSKGKTGKNRMQKLKSKEPRLSRAELSRRAQQYLAEIQKTLMPEHASDFIAINMKTGEYALGKTAHEACDRFTSSWPDHYLFLCRVNGGPAYKFHGK